MAEHRNVETLRNGYEAFGRGDLQAATEAWVDDIVWHVGIPGELGGDYKGTAEVMGFFGKLFEATGGSFKLDVVHITADDEYAFALVETTAERNGKHSNQKNVHVFKLNAEGKGTEFWGFSEDSEAVLEFWA